jgi:plasmid maintenance system killer protein
MIRSFKGRNTESIFSGKRVRGFPGDIQQRARRKLRMLDAAKDLEDLRTPPSNRLEKIERWTHWLVQHSNQQSVAKLFFMERGWRHRC